MFTGHYLDTETGLQNFGARYYDGRFGRFLTQDPYLGRMGEPPSLHRYAYANGNPLRFVDPTGYAAEESLGRDLVEWGKGVAKGVAEGVGEIVAAPFELVGGAIADAGQAGLGYLADEASGGRSTNEINTLTKPIGSFGKAVEANRKNGDDPISAIGRALVETPTGMVRDTIKGLVTLPARSYQAAMSGDPEMFGKIAVEIVMVAEGARGPIKAISSPTLRAPALEFIRRADVAFDLAQRRRISKRVSYEPSTLIKGAVESVERKISDGAFTLRDAWEIAGMCVGRGVQGCAVFGGLSEKKIGNFFKNALETKSVAMDRRIRLFADDNRNVSAWKNPGDLDFAIHYADPSKKVMTDWRKAHEMNERLSAPMFDAAKGHGIMGEQFPDFMIPRDAQQAFRQRNKLAPDAPIRAVEYLGQGDRRCRRQGAVLQDPGDEIRDASRRAPLGELRVRAELVEHRLDVRPATRRGRVGAVDPEPLLCQPVRPAAAGEVGDDSDCSLPRREPVTLCDVTPTSS